MTNHENLTMGAGTQPGIQFIGASADRFLPSRGACEVQFMATWNSEPAQSMLALSVP